MASMIRVITISSGSPISRMIDIASAPSAR